MKATGSMFYHRGSPKDVKSSVKWINHAKTESEPDQPDGPQENGM